MPQDAPIVGLEWVARQLCTRAGYDPDATELHRHARQLGRSSVGTPNWRAFVAEARQAIAFYEVAQQYFTEIEPRP